jgi:phosphonate transport system substrate-binding protein
MGMGLMRRFLAGGLAVLWLSAAGAASADWRDDVEVLKLGVIANGDASYRMTVLEPFRAYLQGRIGVPVELVPVGTYAAMIDAQIGARIHYAIHSVTSFATAVEQCQCVEAIGAPVAASGALGFHAILVARADGPVRTLADARDKRLALAGADSVAGRLVPLQGFAEAGIEPETYFSRIVETADPEAAIKSLLAGESDLAVGWSSLTGNYAAGFDFGVLTRMVADGTLAMDQVRIVWRSRLVPFGPHVVRSDLPPELKGLLAEALRTIAEADPAALDAVDRLGFGGGGFATPDPSLYAVARDLVGPGSSLR